MSENMGAIASASPEGVVRRQAAELRECNQNLQLQRDRLESVRVRMYGPDEMRPDPAHDTPPEPVRNDLEELQYQIATYRDLLEKLSQVVNVMVEL